MTLSFDAPQMSVSMPKEVGWHMILDHELDQLSHSEMGFIGSLGFVGLGAALGLIPQLVDVISKLSAKPRPSPVYPFLPVMPSINTVDIGAVAAFFFCLAITIVCLCLSGIYHHRNKGLAKTIRQRGKHGFPSGTPLRAVT